MQADSVAMGSWGTSLASPPAPVPEPAPPSSEAAGASPPSDGAAAAGSASLASSAAGAGAGAGAGSGGGGGSGSGGGGRGLGSGGRGLLLGCDRVANISNLLVLLLDVHNLDDRIRGHVQCGLSGQLIRQPALSVLQRCLHLGAVIIIKVLIEGIRGLGNALVVLNRFSKSLGSSVAVGRLVLAGSDGVTMTTQSLQLRLVNGLGCVETVAVQPVLHGSQLLVQHTLVSLGSIARKATHQGVAHIIDVRLQLVSLLLGCSDLRVLASHLRLGVEMSLKLCVAQAVGGARLDIQTDTLVPLLLLGGTSRV